MKITKRINNRDYQIKYSPVPRHKLPEAARKIEMEKLVKNNSGKTDLTDVTFMIPLRIESDDRRKCLTIVIDYLVKHFNTNIIVLEEGPGSLFPGMKKVDWDPYLKYIYKKSNEPLFHKTANLNIMTRQTTTPIICALDSDCIFPPSQYVNAVKKIRNGSLDFCYPFNEPLHNITKDLFHSLEVSLDLTVIRSQIKPKTILVPPGGCFFMNKQKFIEGGMENEFMISYGPEDTERRDRLLILGYKVGDTAGPLFHIDHSRTTNSNDHNPLFKKNTEEYEKVRFMSKTQLKDYISTWHWSK